MARMVMLVVLVILWRFPGVVRMPERSQVVRRLLLRRARRWVGLLLDGRESYTRAWWLMWWLMWWWMPTIVLLLYRRRRWSLRRGWGVLLRL